MSDPVEIHVIRHLTDKVEKLEIANKYIEECKNKVEISNDYLKDSVAKKNKEIAALKAQVVQLTRDLEEVKSVPSMVLDKLKVEYDVLHHRSIISCERVADLETMLGLERYAAIVLQTQNTKLMQDNMAMHAHIQASQTQGGNTTTLVREVACAIVSRAVDRVLQKRVGILPVPASCLVEPMRLSGDLCDPAIGTCEEPTRYVSAVDPKAVLAMETQAKLVKENQAKEKQAMLDLENQAKLDLENQAKLEHENQAKIAAQVNKDKVTARNTAQRLLKQEKHDKALEEAKILKEARRVRVLADKKALEEAKVAADVKAKQEAEHVPLETEFVPPAKGTPEYAAYVIRRVETMKKLRKMNEDEASESKAITVVIPSLEEARCFIDRFNQMFEQVKDVPEQSFDWSNVQVRETASLWVIYGALEMYGHGVWVIHPVADNKWVLQCVLSELKSFGCVKSNPTRLEHIAEVLDQDELYDACFEIRRFLPLMRTRHSIQLCNTVELVTTPYLRWFLNDPKMQPLITKLHLNLIESLDSFGLRQTQMLIPGKESDLVVATMTTCRMLQWFQRLKLDILADSICTPV